MATINTIRSAQPYRISVGMSAAPSTTASDYTLTRQDGGSCPIAVALAWVEVGAPSVAELALDAPLLDGVIYLLAVAGAGSAAVSYQPPVARANVAAIGDDDPAAEALGVDISWITDALGPGGDLIRRSGPAALEYDLGAIAVTNPGELFHLPTDGAGVSARVNGPGGAVEAGRAAAALKNQWAKDPRVKRGSIAVTPSIDPSTGFVTFDASVESVAIVGATVAPTIAPTSGG